MAYSQLIRDELFYIEKNLHNRPKGILNYLTAVKAKTNYIATGSMEVHHARK